MILPKNCQVKISLFLTSTTGDKCVLIDEVPTTDTETPLSSRRRTLSSRIDAINKELLENCDDDDDDNLEDNEELS